ncbi:MAG: hypothetical protein KC478_02440 [Bacteriovoracaceae bacterium]|nr:hypothetical protein [Bacteriovoracaceae bacterium]
MEIQFRTNLDEHEIIKDQMVEFVELFTNVGVKEIFRDKFGDIESLVLNDGTELPHQTDDEGGDLFIFRRPSGNVNLRLLKENKDFIEFTIRTVTIEGEYFIFHDPLKSKSFLITKNEDFKRMRSEHLDLLAQLYYNEGQDEA